MNLTKKRFPHLLAVLFAGTAAFAFAQHFGMMGDGGGMMGTQRMGYGMGAMGAHNINAYLMHADELKLTDQQVRQLRDRRTEHMRNSIQTRAKLQTGMVDLCAAMDQENASMTQIRERIEAYQAALTEHLTQAAQTQLDARNILTAAQRQQAMRYETSGWCGMMGMPSYGMSDSMPMYPRQGSPRAR